MPLRPLAAWGLLLALAGPGCSRHDPLPPPRQPTATAARATAPVPAPTADSADAALILADLMDLVVDPAAGVVLAAAEGHATGGHGRRSDEAWQAVADAADQLTRTGAQLANAPLARGRGDWLQATATLNAGATAAAAAARRHDQRALVTAVAQVRASCQACHAGHATPLTEPLAPGSAR